MGVRHGNGHARDRRCLAHNRRSRRADARSHLYRADILRRGHGGARQHDRHARCRHHPRRRRNDRPDPVRRLLGAGHFVRDAARRSRRPAAGPVRQAIMKRNDSFFWIGATLFLAAALLMTQVIGNQYPFFACYVILQFIVLAVAWSILGGYAGYVNFGTSAFFGVGVYTAVFLFKAVGAPLAVQIAAAAVVGALMGFALGLLTLRMQGIYFSIATIALTIVIETSITNWRYVGGAAGVPCQRPLGMEPFDNYVQMLFFVQALLVVLAGSDFRCNPQSWIRRGLPAVQE